MPIRRSHSPTLALVTLTTIGTIGFVDRIVVNALVEPLKEEFSLSDGQIGLLGFAFAALNIAIGLWIARLAESRRRLTFTAVGTLAWSVAATACGFVQNWTQLLLARIAVGVGEAVGLPANQSVLADYFPPNRRATAMSVLLLSPAIGSFIGLAGGGFVAQYWGWRWAFIVTGLPGLFLALFVWLFVAEPLRGAHDRVADDAVPPVSAVIRRFLELPSARHLVMGQAVASMVGFGVIAFLPALLARRFGLPIGVAGLYTAVIASIPAAVSIAAGGWLADRIAPRVAASYALIPAVSLLVAAPLYGLAATRADLVLLLALIGISALLQYNFLGITVGTLQNLMHPRMRATANALTNILSGFAGGLGPVIVGVTSDRLAENGFTPGVALALAMAIGGTLYWWAAAHYFLAARTVAADLEIVREGRI